MANGLCTPVVEWVLASTRLMESSSFLLFKYSFDCISGIKWSRSKTRSTRIVI